MSLPDPFEWMLEKTEDLPVNLDPDHPWFRTVARMVDEKIVTMKMILRRQADMFDEYEKQDAYRDIYKRCAIIHRVYIILQRIKKFKWF